MRFLEIKEKIPKNVIDKLLQHSLKDLPSIKIGNKFYKYNLDKSLKETLRNDEYITLRRRKNKLFRSVMSYFKETKLELREYFVGMIIFYNGITFDYSVKIISVSIYDKKTGKIKHYHNGIYNCYYGQMSFFIDESTIYKESKKYLLIYSLKVHVYQNLDSLKKAKNKYLRSIKEDLSIYDFIMLYKYKEIETYYKKYVLAEFFVRIDFYKKFLNDKLPFVYKIFFKSCFDYLKYSFSVYFRDYQIDHITYYNMHCILRFIKENKVSKKVINYIIKNGQYAYLYCDYYLNCHLFNNKFPLFPKDIVKAHDDLFSLIKIKENEWFEEAINKFNDKYKKLEFNYRNYKFYLPDLTEMVNYSNELNICIAKAGYIERVANGETILLFCKNIINDSKTNKFASELDIEDFHIIQFHGYCNDIGVSQEQIMLREKLLNVLDNKLKEIVRQTSVDALSNINKV